MSLRTFQNIAMVSVLALGAFATGCDDDDKKEPTADAGPGGGKDAEMPGPDASEPPPMGKQCGDTFCPKTKALLGQCCVDEGDVCGIDLRPPTPGAESIGCFPADAPGVKSDHCGVVLDMFEANGEVEGKFEISAGTTNITVPPCCTPAGTCGVDGNMSSAGLLGTGCLDALALQPAPSGDAGMSSGDGGAGGFQLTFEKNGLPILPNTFCDPKTGEAGCIPSEFMGNKVPPFLLGACPTAVKDGCIERVEQNIHGCGEDKKWNRKLLSELCIDNIAEDKWGCDDISAETLARVPEFGCGCGEGKTGGQCIPNTPETTCGTVAVTKTPTAKECMSDSAPPLCTLPEYICGCGDGKLYGSTSALSGFPCLSNVDDKLCGVTPADLGADKMPNTDDDCIAGIDEFLRGCGDTGDGAIWDRNPQTFCLSNVKTTVYGCDEVTEAPTADDCDPTKTPAVNPPAICNYPSVLCGCGDDKTAFGGPFSGLPCLANIPEMVCGQNVGCTGWEVTDGSDSCKGPDACADVAPFDTDGAGPITKDGVGDACGCQPALDHDNNPETPGVDTCQLGPTGATFTCTNVTPSAPRATYRCSCGTVGMQGTCGDGKICTDTDTPANMIGDTCM